MCVAGCGRCVGVALVALSIICMLANVLLLFPGLEVHFLLEGHVTREATWATGLWGEGLLLLIGARSFMSGVKTQGCCAFRTKMLCQAAYSCVCVLVAGVTSMVGATGLAQGPLCLHSTPTGPAWGTPLQPRPDSTTSYLYNRSAWAGACLEPAGVVQWNVLLFSALGGSSALQMLLCAVNTLNLLLGALVGPPVCRNQTGKVGKKTIC